MITRCITTCFSGILSLFCTHQRQCDFQRDLDFIQKTVLENHPGVYNHLDPHFLEQVTKSYAVAKLALNQAHSEEEKVQALKIFGKSFNDSHLWVQYDLKKDSTDKTSTGSISRIFDVQKLENATWISIPTFAPSTSQISSLQEIIRTLPQLRDETIIFDLRGNGGGNSEFGIQLLKALFGDEYATHRLAKEKQNIYVEWRASSGNLEHIKNFIPMLKQQFPESHPVIQWAESTCKGMQNALASGSYYYTEPKPSKNPPQMNRPSPFKGKVIAIIDKGCGSACLDFLDGLNAMQSNTLFIGEPTGSDSVYMELRTIKLPSSKGTFGFPIKVYRNRPRGHNVPYVPDVRYHGDLNDTLALQKFVLGVN